MTPTTTAHACGEGTRLRRQARERTRCGGRRGGGGRTIHRARGVLPCPGGIYVSADDAIGDPGVAEAPERAILEVGVVGEIVRRENVVGLGVHDVGAGHQLLDLGVHVGAIGDVVHHHATRCAIGLRHPHLSGGVDRAVGVLDDHVARDVGVVRGGGFEEESRKGEEPGDAPHVPHVGRGSRRESAQRVLPAERFEVEVGRGELAGRG
mmetsp:Transcript_24159/g.75850  ORF Transcript_24159/g.75850 Transcript_24159/m.75850 type:complete len:208 (+) Transcript_24159:870-1493(+)